MHAGKLFVKYGVPKGLQSSSLEKVLSQVQNCPVDQQLQCGHKGTTHSQLLSNPYCARWRAIWKRKSFGYAWTCRHNQGDNWVDNMTPLRVWKPEAVVEKMSNLSTSKTACFYSALSSSLFFYKQLMFWCFLFERKPCMYGMSQSIALKEFPCQKKGRALVKQWIFGWKLELVLVLSQPFCS